MIQHPFFDVEPWRLRERQFDPEVLAQSESLFTLANGHIGWRGNLDEGEPHGLLGSYLNGVYDLRPLPYAEGGYGYPEQDEVVVNVTDGKIVRLLVDDEPFDIRYGTLHDHERILDFRTGLLERHADWSTPTGKRVKVSSTRVVSFTQRAVAAIKYEVEAVDAVRVVVQSELVANETSPPPPHFDPRAAAVLDDTWRSLEFENFDQRAILVHETSYSNLTMSSAMDHEVSGPRNVVMASESFADIARVTATAALEPGERLTVIKYVAYGWSGQRSKEALRDQTNAALVAARADGWEGLCKEQHDYLDDFWRRADVEFEGDAEIQQAVRFSLFHVLQAGARNELRAIPAKGLTGTGYDGHSFWDSEIFVLPVLKYTVPEAVRHALTWRHSTLTLARERADQLGFKGAAFPWRTIAGAECSAYWPAGTGAFHVGADVAHAVIAYLLATGDEDLRTRLRVRDPGGDGAALYLTRSLRYDGQISHRWRDRARRVQRHRRQQHLHESHGSPKPARCRRLRRAPARGSERALGERRGDRGWRAAADAMTSRTTKSWGARAGRAFYPIKSGASTRRAKTSIPCCCTFPTSISTASRSSSRPTSCSRCTCVATPSRSGEARELRLLRTPHGARLLAVGVLQSVIAAEVGHLALAYDYLAEAALMDLDDLEHNTRDGLHMASLAGAWIALVAGLAGMRSYGRFHELLSAAARRASAGSPSI